VEGGPRVGTRIERTREGNKETQGTFVETTLSFLKLIRMDAPYGDDINVHAIQTKPTQVG
jgi:hypothetical protein